ncbi:hypothetical protein F5Y11DRAFT_350593 [Daldinia sp. FL1419]|nr:hypothetical protein F5Y11DRAFT_350593 [Daldinia sp. FL1419]
MINSEGFTKVTPIRQQHTYDMQPISPDLQDHQDWQDGSIAYLKHHSELSDELYHTLIVSGYVNQAATGHPVIILERSEDCRFYLVTTISAYSSGPFNNYLPPWKQFYHRRKHRGSFRAFIGSARPDRRRPYLQLEGGATLPKPQTSWVYTRNPFVVPSSALRIFDKVQGVLEGTVARMTRSSLEDLLGHFREDSNFGNRWHYPIVIEMLQSPPDWPFDSYELRLSVAPKIPPPITSSIRTTSSVSDTSSDLASSIYQWNANMRESSSEPVIVVSSAGVTMSDPRATPNASLWSSIVKRPVSGRDPNYTHQTNVWDDRKRYASKTHLQFQYAN